MAKSANQKIKILYLLQILWQRTDDQHGLTLEEIIRDVVAPCGKPIFTGLRCGHCTPKLTLPFGVNCRMDADNCTLTILEAAVLD